MLSITVDIQNTTRVAVRRASSIWLDAFSWPSGFRNVVNDRNVFRIEEEEGWSFWKNNTANAELVVKGATVAANGQNQQLHSFLLSVGLVV